MNRHLELHVGGGAQEKNSFSEKFQLFLTALHSSFVENFEAVLFWRWVGCSRW